MPTRKPYTNPKIASAPIDRRNLTYIAGQGTCDEPCPETCKGLRENPPGSDCRFHRICRGEYRTIEEGPPPPGRGGPWVRFGGGFPDTPFHYPVRRLDAWRPGRSAGERATKWLADRDWGLHSNKHAELAFRRAQEDGWLNEEQVNKALESEKPWGAWRGLVLPRHHRETHEALDAAWEETLDVRLIGQGHTIADFKQMWSELTGRQMEPWYLWPGRSGAALDTDPAGVTEYNELHAKCGEREMDPVRATETAAPGEVADLADSLNLTPDEELLAQHFLHPQFCRDLTTVRCWRRVLEQAYVDLVDRDSLEQAKAEAVRRLGWDKPPSVAAIAAWWPGIDRNSFVDGDPRANNNPPVEWGDGPRGLLKGKALLAYWRSRAEHGPGWTEERACRHNGLEWAPDTRPSKQKVHKVLDRLGWKIEALNVALP